MRPFEHVRVCACVRAAMRACGYADVGLGEHLVNLAGDGLVHPADNRLAHLERHIVPAAAGGRNQAASRDVVPAGPESWEVRAIRAVLLLRVRFGRHFGMLGCSSRR